MIRGVRNLSTIGLEAITVFNSKPYFFLFADIDTKESSFLLKVLTFFKINHLSCYYYNTNSGFHVASPCMLKFRHWTKLIEQLKKELPEYRFNALRVSNRGDYRFIDYCNWNDRKYKESRTLHNLFKNRFKIVDAVLMVKAKDTELSFITYNQLSFR